MCSLLQRELPDEEVRGSVPRLGGKLQVLCQQPNDSAEIGQMKFS
jgi:hypothetical protein